MIGTRVANIIKRLAGFSRETAGTKLFRLTAAQGRDQAPASRKSWAALPGDENLVV